MPITLTDYWRQLEEKLKAALTTHKQAIEAHPQATTCVNYLYEMTSCGQQLETHRSFFQVLALKKQGEKLESLAKDFYAALETLIFRSDFDRSAVLDLVKTYQDSLRLFAEKGKITSSVKLIAMHLDTRAKEASERLETLSAWTLVIEQTIEKTGAVGEVSASSCQYACYGYCAHLSQQSALQAGSKEAMEAEKPKGALRK